MRMSCRPNRDCSSKVLRLHHFTSGWPLLLVTLTVILLASCGGGDDYENPEIDSTRNTNNWERIPITTVEENGSTLTYVKAKPDPAGNVYFAYYEMATSPDDVQYHQLKLLHWYQGTGRSTAYTVANQPAPTGVDGFDFCSQFDLAVDAAGNPVLIYSVDEALSNAGPAQFEADIMVNFFDAGTWSESIAVLGYVARNAEVYPDGDASSSMAMAIDSVGDIHIGYQFRYENIDSANQRHPDLYYVHRNLATIHDPIANLADYGQFEELVDGNSFSTYADQDSVGFECDILIDELDQPVLIYSERQELDRFSPAVRIAFRDNETGTWRQEAIETFPDSYEVSSISAAYFPDGSIGVAYGVTIPDPEPDRGHRVKFASNQTGNWVTEIVDETTWCGEHSRLAISEEGIPAIVYKDIQSHVGREHQFLNYAQLEEDRWVKESIDEYGDIGMFNSFWIDAEGRAFVVSYAEEDNQIVLYRQYGP